MKAVWVTRSFLDYRIPVYRALSKRLNDGLTLVFNADYVPDRCVQKARQALGHRAKGLRGEVAIRMGPQKEFANRGFRFPYQRGLVRAVLEERPDVLITDGFFQWTAAALWLRATRGIPHVMCYEKTEHTERNAPWYRTAYRKLARRWIDALCCNGSLSGVYAQRLGFPAQRIRYGNMVADIGGLLKNLSLVTDEQRAQIAARHELRGAVFLYVGRLIRLKGLRELLVGWKHFAAQSNGQETTLLMVGEGPERGVLEQYCREHGLHNVRLAGEIDYDHLAAYYQCADAFVIPTLEDNWSLVVAEAMACGLPILCSKYNGCWPELVTEANGWVFDPLRAEEICGVLKQALASKDRWKQMGENSRGIVSTYTADWAAQAIHAACLQALGLQSTDTSLSKG